MAARCDGARAYAWNDSNGSSHCWCDVPRLGEADRPGPASSTPWFDDPEFSFWDEDLVDEPWQQQYGELDVPPDDWPTDDPLPADVQSEQQQQQQQQPQQQPPHPSAAGGEVGCALYPSTTDGLRSEAELFGARSSPFARHEVGSIPTPFGVLHLTAFYDSSLDVGAAMRARAERMALLGTGAMAMAMAMPQRGGATGGRGQPLRGAIPILGGRGRAATEDGRIGGGWGLGPDGSGGPRSLPVAGGMGGATGGPASASGGDGGAAAASSSSVPQAGGGADRPSRTAPPPSWRGT